MRPITHCKRERTTLRKDFSRTCTDVTDNSIRTQWCLTVSLSLGKDKVEEGRRSRLCWSQRVPQHGRLPLSLFSVFLKRGFGFVRHSLGGYHDLLIGVAWDGLLWLCLKDRQDHFISPPLPPCLRTQRSHSLLLLSPVRLLFDTRTCWYQKDL